MERFITEITAKNKPGNSQDFNRKVSFEFNTKIKVVDLNERSYIMQQIKKTIIIIWLFCISKKIFSFLLVERIYFHINIYPKYILTHRALSYSFPVE